MKHSLNIKFYFFEDSFNTTARPTNGKEVQQTTLTNAQPSESTKYASTEESEELVSPTVIVVPTTEGKVLLINH